MGRDKNTRRVSIKRDQNEGGPLRRFQDFFDFRVIYPLNLLLILECGLLADMSVDLETRFVQGMLILFPADVVDNHQPSLCWSLVCLWFAYVCWCRKAAITGIFVVVELGKYVMTLSFSRDGLCPLDLVGVA